MENCDNWYRLCLAILGTFGFLSVMHFGYSLTIGKRTARLEKKNGHEQHQLDELKKEVKRLKSKKSGGDKN